MLIPDPKWPGWKRKAKYRICTFCGAKQSSRKIIHDPAYDTPICKDRKLCMFNIGLGPLPD